MLKITLYYIFFLLILLVLDTYDEKAIRNFTAKIKKLKNELSYRIKNNVKIQTLQQKMRKCFLLSYQ